LHCAGHHYRLLWRSNPGCVLKQGTADFSKRDLCLSFPRGRRNLFFAGGVACSGNYECRCVDHFDFHNPHNCGTSTIRYIFLLNTNKFSIILLSHKKVIFEWEQNL
jgi:hypothetical protein